MNYYLRLALKVLIPLAYGGVVLIVGGSILTELVHMTRFTEYYYINIIWGLATPVLAIIVTWMAFRGWGMPSSLRQHKHSSDNKEPEE